MIRVCTPGELARFAGRELSLDEPVVVTATLIARFVEVSGDRQRIHLPEHAERVVAPGNLLVSLVPAALQRLIQVAEPGRVLTAGYRQVRFREPVHAGEAIRFSGVIGRVASKSERTFVETAVAWRCARSGSTVMTLVVTDCYVTG